MGVMRLSACLKWLVVYLVGLTLAMVAARLDEHGHALVGAIVATVSGVTGGILILGVAPEVERKTEEGPR